MKQPCNYTLDQDVIAGLDLYISELVKSLPPSMQKGARIRSQAVNDIIKEFLQNGGYMRQLSEPTPTGGSATTIPLPAEGERR